MTSSEDLSSHFQTTWNDASEGDGVYSRFSVPAIISLLFGVASFLVYMTPWFAFLSVLGIVFALFALLSIRSSEGAIAGTRTAQLGLAASVISLVSISVMWPSYQYGVKQEAKQFFQLWFNSLAQDDVAEAVPLAMGFSSMYWERPRRDDAKTWWTTQYSSVYSHKAVHKYVENELVRTLLALGAKAKVSYYKTLSVNTSDSKDVVAMIYAVTYQTDQGKNETFFVKMTGERRFPSGKDVQTAGWSLTEYPTYYLPDEFKSTAALPHSLVSISSN
ncbi:MAG: hypothetical protein ACRCUY_11475 [Thermoguttaceae bacterium]